MNPSLCCLLAQGQAPLPKSTLQWMFEALGPLYGVLLPLAGLALFVGACLVVGLNRRPAVIAAFLVFLPLPLLMGLFGSVQAFIASLQIIALAGATPKPSEVSAAVASGLFTTLLGLAVTFPSYLVLGVGLFLRAAQAEQPRHK